MQVSDNDEKVMIVEGFQIAASPDDPFHVVLRLSATREGPHFNFPLDAPSLDQLRSALGDAAGKIRKRAN